jgi:hypothetical protein
MKPEGPKPFPAVSKDLLEELERLFPDKLPTIYRTEAEIGRLIGMQDVMRKLRHEYDAQQKNILTT